MSDQTPQPDPSSDPEGVPTPQQWAAPADTPAEAALPEAVPPPAVVDTGAESPTVWAEPVAAEAAAPEPGAEPVAPTAEQPLPPPTWPAAPATGYPAEYPPVAGATPPVLPPPPAYPAGYAPAAPGYPPAPQTSSNAIIALILAIVSWAVCPIIAAVVALVLASSAGKEIAASGGRIQGAGLVTAARVVAWINIGLYAALLVIGAFFLVLFAATGNM